MREYSVRCFGSWWHGAADLRARPSLGQLNLALHSFARSTRRWLASLLAKLALATTLDHDAPDVPERLEHG